MSTQKLYYENQYISTFSAKVESVIKNEDGTFVVLDKTAFFPEGGGQPSDTGFFVGKGTKGENSVRIYDVVDVQIKDDIIYHRLAVSCPPSVGDELECTLDFEKRFSAMQQHSGEHIFSGVIHNLYGLENVGFHLGEDEVTMDFPRVLTAEELNEIENQGNAIVWKNVPINCFFPSDEELSVLEYRSKKELAPPIRIVEIQGHDVCACCAPHVARTGEVGLIKIVGTRKVRGGTRISILCGNRALEYVGAICKQNREISNLLSEPETKTADAVRRVIREKEQLASALYDAKLNLARLESENISGASVVRFCEFDGDFLRKYADMLAQRVTDYSVALSGNDGSYRFVMITKSEYDLSSVLEKIKPNLAVKGGGRGAILQGSVQNTKEEIEAAFAKL